MERQVIFRAGQDADPDDFNNLQAFAQGSLDHLVKDGVTPDRAFAGFATAITAVADVEVAAGRLYSGGKVFARETVVAKSFLTSLPVATKKHVLVVVHGQEAETDARPREYLINEETGQSEPRVLPMERARIAVVNFQSGQESPDPIDPIVDAGVLPIARIVLTPAGVDRVEMLAANALSSVAAIAGKVTALEGFRAAAGPQIVALGGDLASLRQGQSGLVGKEAFGRVIARVATIEAKNGIPAAAADSACDFFLDETATDPAFAGYQARVSEGVRFAFEQSVETALALSNPLDPQALVAGGLLTPAHTDEVRLAVGPRQGEIQASAYSYQANALVQRTMVRRRVRFGGIFALSTSAAWWLIGRYDYAGYTLAKAGEVLANSELGRAVIQRNPGYWVDTYEESYWSKITTPQAVPGQLIAETFLNANEGLLTAVTLDFTRLAADGAVTLAICETDRGAPDLSRVISKATIDRANLRIGATKYPVGKVKLEGGTRYAIVVITAGDHWLATTQGVNFPQGTLFYVLDGAFQQGDGTKDLCFSLHFAKFAQSRAVIELQGLQLAGGLAAIDILADAIVPQSCDLTYEVRIGAVWTPLASAYQAALTAGGAMPDLLPLRAVFTGTPDIMPIVNLTGSRVRVARPRVTFTHVSTARALPGGGSTQIRVVGRVERYDAAHHAIVAKLRTGAGHATVVAASSYVDVAVEDGIERTWLFNLGAAVTSYRIQLEGTTDSALRPFHVSTRKDYAL